MNEKINSAKSILLILVLCLFIMGYTDDGILGLQEEAEVFSPSETSDTDDLLTAKDKKNHFNANLKGKNEVPPNSSKATGEAIVTIIMDENIEQSKVHFKVNVANIIDVTMAHFHSAIAGKNGGVVATIYPTSDPTGRMQGLLAEGDVTLENLNGMTMEDFILAIRNGGIYVNVHTSGIPGGEIRGQL